MDYAIGTAGDHLSVRISGAPSEREARAMLADMVAASTQAGCSAALIELRVAYGLDPVSIFSLVRDLPSVGFPVRYRFAILLLDDAARDAAHFAETAAANRGWKVRVFREREAALDWIRAG